MIPLILFRRWGRNGLSVMALAISFAMVISLLSISLGLERAAEGITGGTPRDLVITSIGLNPSIEDSHRRALELAGDRANVSGAMPVLTVLGTLGFPIDGSGTDIGPEGIGPDNIFKGSLKEEPVGMVGLVPWMAAHFIEDGKLLIRSEAIDLSGWFRESGSPYRNSSYEEGWTGEMLLDENLMRAYGLEVGSIVLNRGENGSFFKCFRIVGTIRTSLLGGGLSSQFVSGIALVHLGELQHLSGYDEVPSPGKVRRDLSTAVYLDISNEASDPESRRALMVSLESEFPGLKVTTKEDRLYRVQEEVVVLRVFSLGVGATAIFIAALFLSSIVMLDVEDRRRDIAIMRAIGISRATLFLGTMRDSLLLTALGLALGLIPGIFTGRMLDQYLRDLYGVRMDFSHMTVELVVIAGGVMMISVMALSILPALRGISADLRRSLSLDVRR